MRKLSINEIRYIELELLQRLDRLCNERNLRYYLCGGTLLGAIRHKGFIPWDDDIDVCMPRPDYEELVELANSEELFGNHIKFVSYENGTYNHPYGKLLDTRTKFFSRYFNDSETNSIWIDVFPVDGVSGHYYKDVLLFSVINFLRRIIILSTATPNEGKTVIKTRLKGVFAWISRLISSERCCKAMRALALRTPYETAEYVGIVTNGLYGVGERQLKVKFETMTKVTFEQFSFPATAYWDDYLSSIYGNYMTLPPEGERKTHELDAWLVEEK